MCAVKIGRLGKFDLNPRGELWRKDENRFGHRFLKKFGWSQGKGLGKNEDGIAENLKVRMKLGNTGVGWDEKLPIGIDYREYDAVLQDLSKRYQKRGEAATEDVSLEKRSQQFKNRIHYQKFVRGKDTSRYTEKDMSCIFLSREPEKEMESTSEESSVTNIESRPSDVPAKEATPTFNSQLSIADYFALKMKNKFGSSLNAPKETKICEQPSGPETEAKSKKWKHEPKSVKKAKRMKHQLEFEESSSGEDGSSESSSSSRGAAEENLIFREQFQDSGDGARGKKRKTVSKKIAKTLNPRPDVENDSVAENSIEALDHSHENGSNSVEESEANAENEPTPKKRKKEQKSSKKAKKPRLEEAEIFTSFEKNSSFSESDDVEKISSEENTIKSVKTENDSLKDDKKYKNKFSSLKSCLSSSGKYSFKQKRHVSFCDSISYKIIENVPSNNSNSNIVLETNEQLLCSDEDSEVLNETTENPEVNHVDDSESSGKSSDCGNEMEQSDSEEVETNVVPECFKLPKRSSENYDGWLETQRIAARMKVYKNMAKKMKRHPVLRKTNLLEIKGYGNWGL